jgi:hypothetical protein
MAKAQTGTRITIQLDRRVALEAILLNRLGQMPTHRRQEWLRGLLVQGFRNECQALKGLSGAPMQPPMKSFGRVPVTSRNVASAEGGHSMPPQTADGHSSDKPFAALRRVIG